MRRQGNYAATIPLYNVRERGYLVSGAAVAVARKVQGLCRNTSHMLCVSNSVRFFLGMLLQYVFNTRFPNTTISVFRVIHVNNNSHISRLKMMFEVKRVAMIVWKGHGNGDIVI